MNDSHSEDPKIIVDDDWKAQVEQEKATAKQQTESAPESDSDAGIPPASFPILISTLASQALSGLGAIPDPIENKPVIRLELAKHMIDTLGVLEEKTKGNLSSEEAQMLTSTLHQLRMAYLSIQQEISAGQTSEQASDPPQSQIELP